MIKTAMVLAFLAVSYTTYAYAQNTPVSDAFSQDREAISEDRTQLNKHSQAIEALQKQVATNNKAMPASQVTEKKHSDRFLWVVQQCSKLAALPDRDQWTLDQKYNKFSDEQLKVVVEDCKDPNRYRNRYYEAAVQQSQGASVAVARVAPPTSYGIAEPVQVAQAYPPMAPGYSAPPPSMAYGYRSSYYSTGYYRRARPIRRRIETVPPELRSSSYRCNPDGTPSGGPGSGTGWCHRH